MEEQREDLTIIGKPTIQTRTQSSIKTFMFLVNYIMILMEMIMNLEILMYQVMLSLMVLVHLKVR